MNTVWRKVWRDLAHNKARTVLVVLSIAVGVFALGVIGEGLVYTSLEFTYSTSGMMLWLLIVIALSALSSLGPALQATGVSVREALAYE